MIGDIGIYFKPERLVRRALAEVYADPAMVTPERVQALRRAAALSRQPRGDAAARAHPGAARSDAAQAARRADPDHLGRARTAGCRSADAFRFQGDIKGAELAIFEKLGHNPMEEDPKATAAAVAAFLKPIAAAAPRRRPTPIDTTRPSVGDAGEGLASATASVETREVSA